MRSAAAHSGSRTATAPRTRSEWPESAFVALYIDGVRAVVERPLPERRRQRVVDREPGAGGVRGVRDRGDVADVEPGLDGVSIQTSFAPSQAATIASVSVGTSRTSTPRGASRSLATPRTPG